MSQKHVKKKSSKVVPIMGCVLSLISSGDFNAWGIYFVSLE